MPLVEFPVRVGAEQATTGEELVYVLTRYLAGQCDGARVPDGHGFNKIDQGFGHKLAEMPMEEWTPRQLWAARKMLVRYSKTQLAPWWSGVPEIPEPDTRNDHQKKKEASYQAYKRKQDPNWQPEQTFRRFQLDKREGQSVVILQHNYDERLVAAIKALPHRKFDGDKKYWWAPLHIDSIEPMLDFALEWGYEIPDDVMAECDNLVNDLRERMSLSHANDADLHVKGIGGELFPFQKAGVKYAVKTKNVLIGDEMGLGKTPQSLVTLQATSSFPALIVCPASLKANWKREAEKWIPGCRAHILGSHVTPLTHFDGTAIADVFIVNYNSVTFSKWFTRLQAVDFKAIVCDEAHALKNPGAKQTQLLTAMMTLKSQARRIFLTGTPVVNRPMEFWSLVSILGYGDEFGGPKAYKARYDTKYTSRLEELNDRSRQMFFVRRLKKDVLKELPPKMRTSVPIEMEDPQAYYTIEADVAHFLANKKAEDEDWTRQTMTNLQKAKALNPDLDIEEEFSKEKKLRYNAQYLLMKASEQLARWEVLKQAAVRQKMRGIKEWIENFLDSSDQKLVLFASHTAIIEEVANLYKDRYGAVFIHGQVQVDKRQPLVDRFQTDPKCRLIVGNMIAMGEGLTLTASSNVAFIEFGWNPKTHDQAEDRCHRIGQHDSVMVWNLVAENTIDEEIVEMIESKRLITTAIQDGAGADSQREMMDELARRMEERRRRFDAGKRIKQVMAQETIPVA
jgi:SNF2 family DNA or RNA helicase